MSKYHVVINGKQYTAGYPLCAGCPNLTIDCGWECWYKRDTTECEYPDILVKEYQALASEKAYVRSVEVSE